MNFKGAGVELSVTIGALGLLRGFWLGLRPGSGLSRVGGFRSENAFLASLEVVFEGVGEKSAAAEFAGNKGFIVVGFKSSVIEVFLGDFSCFEVFEINWLGR